MIFSFPLSRYCTRFGLPAAFRPVGRAPPLIALAISIPCAHAAQYAASTLTLITGRPSWRRSLSAARKSGGAIRELERRNNLEQKLEQVRKELPARQVRVTPDPAVLDLATLPAGVKLRAGKLEIEFFGAQDLLRQLFAVARRWRPTLTRFRGLWNREVRRNGTAFCQTGMV